MVCCHTSLYNDILVSKGVLEKIFRKTQESSPSKLTQPFTEKSHVDSMPDTTTLGRF